MSARRQAAGRLYLCRNGHIVRQSWRAGLDCSRCKANDQRRRERGIAKVAPAGSAA